MRYFNGFFLKNEEIFFQDYIIDSDYCVAGFSYGAQRAFEFVYNSPNRVDRLILLSPAFFQDKDNKFKRMQLIFFQKDKQSYINNFLNNVIYPSTIDILHYLQEGTFKQLQELLYYQWDKDKLNFLVKNGVILEIYLGQKDKIINANKAKEFFKEFGEIYFIKNVGHILLLHQ